MTATKGGAAPLPRIGSETLTPRIRNGLPAPGLFPTVGRLFAFYSGGGG